MQDSLSGLGPRKTQQSNRARRLRLATPLELNTTALKANQGPELCADALATLRNLRCFMIFQHTSLKTSTLRTHTEQKKPASLHLSLIANAMDAPALAAFMVMSTFAQITCKLD